MAAAETKVFFPLRDILHQHTHTQNTLTHMMMYIFGTPEFKLYYFNSLCLYKKENKDNMMIQEMKIKIC